MYDPLLKGYEFGLQPQKESNFKKVENVVSYWGVESIKETFQSLTSLIATEMKSILILVENSNSNIKRPIRKYN